MKIGLSVFLLSGCVMKAPVPYPSSGKDTGAIDTGDEEPSEPSSEPDDTQVDTGADTDTGGQDTDTGGQDTGSTDPNAIEILGNYISNTGDYHYIRSNSYTIDYGIEEYVYHYENVNNFQRWMVASNDSSNGPDEAGKFSKFFWLIDANNQVWVCQATATASTQTEAENTFGISAGNMESGCNGLPWWGLTRQ